MKIFGKKTEARSWNGETAGEQQRSNDAPNNPCKGGHSWAYTRSETRTLYGRQVTFDIYDCVRGCGATKEERK